MTMICPMYTVLKLIMFLTEQCTSSEEEPMHIYRHMSRMCKCINDHILDYHLYLKYIINTAPTKHKYGALNISLYSPVGQLALHSGHCPRSCFKCYQCTYSTINIFVHLSILMSLNVTILHRDRNTYFRLTDTASARVLFTNGWGIPQSHCQEKRYDSLPHTVFFCSTSFQLNYRSQYSLLKEPHMLLKVAYQAIAREVSHLAPLRLNKNRVSRYSLFTGQTLLYILYTFAYTYVSSLLSICISTKMKLGNI